jgi:hypothetical protein
MDPCVPRFYTMSSDKKKRVLIIILVVLKAFFSLFFLSWLCCLLSTHPLFCNVIHPLENLGCREKIKIRATWQSFRCDTATTKFTAQDERQLICVYTYFFILGFIKVIATIYTFP